MENSNELPICTLKVDFGCTDGCSKDVTNMLKQLKGVKSISIDPSEGKVIVIGDVNPMKLIKFLQKMGKKVQLWSFDKEPKNKKACSHAKHHSRAFHESSDIEDDAQTNHGHKHHHQKNKKMYDRHSNIFGFDNQHGPPRPPPPYNYQPFPGYHNIYHPTMHGYQPQHGGYAMPPSMYPGQPRATYGPYGSMFPSYNPMVHYTNYEDNYIYTI
ncbi:heavy metal-associated isoprenylated plant protein 36 [Lathyrus oleraceus]|uniref:HMA domain-containing protein n=1 Tax=Pisum sativum TaxID=3888 RepID=A0A9D5AQJ7_PEA|nr:heavy metal-associated isoprenylated plant protein 36-like [Pisum sativum]KAI5414680.1 hypothetical protein KIW84_040235 [Pisum sativum]